MQDMHIDLDKIIVILEKKIKTKAIVSHCQKYSGRRHLEVPNLIFTPYTQNRCRLQTGSNSPSKCSLHLTFLIRKQSSQNKGTV